VASSSQPAKAEVPAQNKQLDSFLEVMQPRNKGPSWANEEKVHEPSMPEVGPSDDVGMVGSTGPEQEGLSDMEWLKRRMTENVDQVNSKMFEQSDDEDEVPKKKAEAVSALLYSCWWVS
jgi:multiple RNA-binding domain-containing protein 1